MATSIGSVGKYMSKLSPGIIVLSSIDSGAKKTAIQISLSNEKITNKAPVRITGRRFSTIESFFTTNQMFNNMNDIEIR
jgi:hypothetical protein